MATYVVGDIHGCYDEWIALKDRIEGRDKQAKFILVGDIMLFIKFRISLF